MTDRHNHTDAYRELATGANPNDYAVCGYDGCDGPVPLDEWHAPDHDPNADPFEGLNVHGSTNDR